MVFLNRAQGNEKQLNKRYLPENLIKSRPETPIRGLTQGGQDILSCGVGTVVTTGLLAAGHVTGRKLLLEAEGLRQAKKITVDALPQM